MSYQFFHAAHEAASHVAVQNQTTANEIVRAAEKILNSNAYLSKLPTPHRQNCIAKEILQARRYPAKLLPRLDEYLSRVDPGLRDYSLQYLAVWLAREQKFDKAMDVARKLRWARIKADTYLDIAKCQIYFGHPDDAARLLAITAKTIAQDYTNYDRNKGTDAEVNVLIYSARTKATTLLTVGDIQESIGRGEDARQSILMGLKALQVYTPGMP